VAGAAALLWSAFPHAPNLLIKEYLMASVDTISSLAGKTLTGGRLNVFAAIGEPDSIPPAAVTDLAAADHRSNSIGLAWTATGDDSTSGTASAYDIRYSMSPIDSGNFDSALEALGEPAPRPSGEAEFFRVTGLDFNTTYYFAMKARDNWENWSGISNTVSGTTLGIPAVSTSPESLTDSLMTGETAVHAVTIRNVGEGTWPGAPPRWPGAPPI
jgi:hypothetical protein